MTITELAKLLDQQLEMLYPDTGGQWYGGFRQGEVIEGGVLIGVCGRGETTSEALADYVSEIAGKRMAFRAMTDKRMEFVIPSDLTP